MAFSLLTVLRCSEFLLRPGRLTGALAVACLGLALQSGESLAKGPELACKGTLYLTFDTGAMHQADTIAAILRKHQVKATFFLANEKTFRGDHALDPSWAGYWKERVAEGHHFGSHTFDHVYFKPASKRAAAGAVLHAARPQFGSEAGRDLMWSDAQLCAELDRAAKRFQSLTGKSMLPLWRAPGGRAPAGVMSAANACGYRHVYWAAAGFLGDELSSEKFPNDALLQRALSGLRDGDVIMAHLGIWSRKDAFAPMLDPLIAGLKERGFCFATLDPDKLPAAAGPQIQ